MVKNMSTIPFTTSPLYMNSHESTPLNKMVMQKENCHLIEVARSILFQMSIPNTFWGKVVLTDVYLINWVIFGVLVNFILSKFMLLNFLLVLILHNLLSRVFDCFVFVHVHEQYHNKFDPYVVLCFFFGLCTQQKRVEMLASF